MNVLHRHLTIFRHYGIHFQRACGCFLAGCTVLALLGIPSLAQQATSRPDAAPSRAYWLSGGFGMGTISEGRSNDDNKGGAIAGTIAASYARGEDVFTARMTSAGEIFGDAAGDIGLLYGRAVWSEVGFASAGIGLAAVTGFHDEDGLDLHCGLFSDCEMKPPKSFTTIGVPFEIRLFLQPLRYVGIGVYGFANLNLEASFAGASVALQLGLLR